MSLWNRIHRVRAGLTDLAFLLLFSLSIQPSFAQPTTYVTNLLDQDLPAGQPLFRPGSVAIDSQFNVYVADSRTNGVHRVSPAGEIIQVADLADFSASGTGSSDFPQPKEILVAKDDSVAILSTTGRLFHYQPGQGAYEVVLENFPNQKFELFTLDNSGALYLLGTGFGVSHANIFKINTSGTVEVINAFGFSIIEEFLNMLVDDQGNIILAGRENVVKITAAGVITKIIESAGDGDKSYSNNASNIALAKDSNGRVVVSAENGLWQIFPDGSFSFLLEPPNDVLIYDMVIDDHGSIYALLNVKIFPGFELLAEIWIISDSGEITEVSPFNASEKIDSLPTLAMDIALGQDGRVAFTFGPLGIVQLLEGNQILLLSGELNGFGFVEAIVADVRGNAYLGLDRSVLKLSRGEYLETLLYFNGTREIEIDGITELALAEDGDIYIAARNSDNPVVLAADGTIREIIDSSGDGTAELNGPWNLAYNSVNQSVYVAGFASDNVFEIDSSGAITGTAFVNHITLDPRGTVFLHAGHAGVVRSVYQVEYPEQISSSYDPATGYLATSVQSSTDGAIEVVLRHFSSTASEDFFDFVSFKPKQFGLHTMAQFDNGSGRLEIPELHVVGNGIYRNVVLQRTTADGFRFRLESVGN